MTSRDEEHLKLLSIFHYVMGGLVGLWSCIFIFHVVFGIVMIAAPDAFGEGDAPPPFFGWIFVVMGSVAIFFGWTFAIGLLYAGTCLSRRTHYVYCIVAAAIGCLFVPLGTVLGVFTLVTLMRPSVKELFDVPTGSVPMGSEPH